MSTSRIGIGVLAALALLFAFRGATRAQGEAPAYRTEWVPARIQDHAVDGAALAADLSRVVDGLAREGFEIVAVTPVGQGHVLDRARMASVGFGVTGGVIVTARKPG